MAGSTRSRFALLLATLVACLGAAALAADEPPAAKEAAETAQFRAEIAPLLVKYCRECHSGSEPKGELSLEPLIKRAALADDRQSWDKVAQKLRAGEMPPEEQPQPSAAERKRLVEWLEGVLARSACDGPRDPGRVTLRRLNRNEYNNTIRDLVGIDFHPADDFPSDDVGYGFDNIGDVLSMPPLLLEKYLAAAQKIVARAMGIEQVNLLTGEIEGGQLIGSPWRMLSSRLEIRAKFRSFGQGHYIFRVRAYGQQAGDEPVKMGLYVDNDTIATLDVKAVDGKPELYEAWANIKGGAHTFSVVFLNDYYAPDKPEPNDRNLVVGELEAMGPYPPSYKQIIPREHTPENKLVLAREVLVGFMTRAFRRPVKATEVDRVLKLVALADAEGDDFGAAIGLGLEAVLASPHFLFRIELDPEPNNPATIRTLNDFELATRLSYFLWSTMPDDELFTHARQGTLRQGQTLAEQVRRMLRDPKAQALVENFAGQWLQLRNLKIASPDKQTYPGFDEPLRAAMQRETELFFANLVAEDRSVLELIDADYTFVNERLARHYGIPDVKGDEFRRVTIDPATRGGVLLQASVLTVTSNPTRTSPVKRGKWVLENLLGTPPPPPPAAVPPLAEEPAATDSGSLRERMEQHRAKAECAVCHNRMDPLGFGLENYDGIGAWRSEDGKFKIDPSGTLPDGSTFAGPGELKSILKVRQDDFLHCLAEKLLTYGLGRGVEYSDQCTLADIVKAAKENDFRFSSLVLAIVASDAFQKRKGKGTD